MMGDKSLRRDLYYTLQVPKNSVVSFKSSGGCQVNAFCNFYLSQLNCHVAQRSLKNIQIVSFNSQAHSKPPEIHTLHSAALHPTHHKACSKRSETDHHACQIHKIHSPYNQVPPFCLRANHY